MVYIGIDPGLAGGIAILNNSGQFIAAIKMPPTERDVFETLARWAVYYDEGSGNGCRATLEFVRSSPQMGVASAFKFGQGYGALKMALVAVGIPFDEVTPQKWQKVMQCRSGGDKNVTKKRAQELFPSCKMTHALADALLIAEFGRRVAQRG
jgi:hypothetical protein